VPSLLLVSLWLWLLSTLVNLDCLGMSDLVIIFRLHKPMTSIRRWGLIVAIIFAAIFLPFTVVVVSIFSFINSTVQYVLMNWLLQYAITGFNPDIQSLIQILGAALMPGSPQTNMYFTLYGYNTVLQARGLIRDLKMVGGFLIDVSNYGG
jgi:hypothetical protein